MSKADPQQLARALRFGELNAERTLLILPNAWDAGSARVYQHEGFTAAGTTSAGIAWSHGFPDGHHLPRERIIESTARMAAVLSIPLSADIESGYGNSPKQVGETVAAILEAGAVGINLEDGVTTEGDAFVDAQLHAERVRAARSASDEAEVPLYINARTDVYLRPFIPAEKRLGETLQRLHMYVAAGADGVFVPGLTDPSEIKAILGELDLPLNLYAAKTLPPMAELESWGVRRLSVGSGPMMRLLGELRGIARSLRARDGYDWLEGAISPKEIKAIFSSVDAPGPANAPGPAGAP